MAQEQKVETQSPGTSFPKRKIQILLLENIAQSAVDYFVKQGYTVETAKHLNDEQLIKKVQECHVLGIRSKTKLRKHILKHATKLLCIGHFCIGTDQTDLDVARELGIPVFNVCHNKCCLQCFVCCCFLLFYLFVFVLFACLFTFLWGTSHHSLIHEVLQNW